MAQRGFRTIALDLKKTGPVSVYTSSRLADALQDIMGDMKLYDGVRLTQVLEAVYLQGKKDGARDAFVEIEAGMTAAKKQIPHQNPGRPRRSGSRRAQ